MGPLDKPRGAASTGRAKTARQHNEINLFRLGRDKHNPRSSNWGNDAGPDSHTGAHGHDGADPDRYRCADEYAPPTPWPTNTRRPRPTPTPTPEPLGGATITADSSTMILGAEWQTFTINF